MRSDATRNHEAILTGAIAVLAGSPNASMREIAEASGTGRTTLYRHFPDRGALIAAIYDRVFAEAGEITEAALAAGAGRDPVAVLADLSAELSGLGDRYRFLEQHVAHKSVVANGPERAGDSPLPAYIEAAQRAGRVRADLPAQWLFETFVSIVMQAAGFTDAGPDERRAMTSATIRAVFAAPADA